MYNDEGKVIYQPYDMTVEQIIQDMENGELKYSFFCRNYIWSKFMASAFIESLLVQMPTPFLLFKEEKDGIYSIIDGRQRIETVIRFIRKEGTPEELRLEGMEILTNLNGKSFSELSQEAQSVLLNQYIRCLVILQGTEDKIVADLFQRFNMHDTHFSEQEIRDMRDKG